MSISTKVLVQRLLAKVISKPGVDIHLRSDIKNFLYKYGKELEGGSTSSTNAIQQDLLTAFFLYFIQVHNDSQTVVSTIVNATDPETIATFNSNSGLYIRYGLYISTDDSRYDFNNFTFKLINTSTNETLLEAPNIIELNNKCLSGICSEPTSLGYPIVVPTLPYQISLIAEPTDPTNYLTILPDTPITLTTYGFTFD